MSAHDSGFGRDDANLPFRFEVVRGEREEVFALHLYPSMVAHHFCRAIDEWVRTNDLGEPCLFMAYRLNPSPETCRYADVSFVSEERWPRSRPMSRTDDYWPVVPDLAAYVIRPTDYFTDVAARTEDFLDAGTKSVWLIDPGRNVVQVIDAADRSRPRLISDELTGGDALPGFRTPLRPLFSHTV